MTLIHLPTRYYQQFDADFSLETPGEGYGGWKTAMLPLDLDHTAVVVMHAWESGTRQDYPGWYRAVEYIPRAQAICREVFPGLLAAVRQSPLKLFHVVGGGDYYKKYPGYHFAQKLAVAEPAAPAPVEKHDAWDDLQRFRSEHVFVGLHNQADTQKGFAHVDFPPEAKPLGKEGIAENRYQLYGLCRHFGIDHLIYVGFAINWCLLLSPGGMAEMSQHGLLCSTIPQAVTAVENKETARNELGKQNALWRVALAFGFVYELDDFLHALRKEK